MSTAPRAFALPAAPATYGAAALATATFAGLGVVGRPAGLGLSLTLLALVGLGVRLRGDSPKSHWVLAAGLALVPTLRTAGWVVAPSVLGCLGLTIAAAAHSDTWGRLFSAPGRWLVSLVPGPVVSLALAGRGTSSAVLRGLAGAALLVALFGSLLAAADAAFAGLADDLMPGLDLVEARIGLAVLVLGAAGALALVAALPRPEATPGRVVVGRTEASIALGALAALFAVFVAVQAATLFGGDAFVRRAADLTYAQYARSGFWLLLVVAALTLGVIAAAVRWTAIDRRWLGVLGVLTLVILASAWHRLDLYTDAYGPTRAREFAAWSIAWLAGLFALVLARRGVPRTVLTWSAVLGLAFGLSNPDARIAGATRDAAYRATLSDDAGGCVDRGGGVLSVTLPALTRGC